MCTAFVKYGKDYICGFNMDINAGAMDWRLLMDDQVFAVFPIPDILRQKEGEGLGVL